MAMLPMGSWDNRTTVGPGIFTVISLHQAYSFIEIPGVRSSPSIRCGWVCRIAYELGFGRVRYLSDVA